MAEIQMPPKDARILNRLAAIPLPKLQRLFEALQKVDAGVYILGPLTDSVRGFSEENDLAADDVAKVVRALNQTRISADDISDADFVKSIIAGVRDANSGEVSDESTLQTIIVNILSLNNIRLSAKATSLAFDSQFHLHKVGIVSDLRPIFDQDRSEVQAFFVANTLKIEYADDRESSKTIFFALDDDDLEAIATALDNARKKRAALKLHVGKLGLPILEMSK